MGLPRIAMLSIMFGCLGYALYSVESFTSLFMHESFSLGFTIIGIIFTLSNLAGSVFQIYTGRLGDRIGHKKMLLITYAVASVSMIMLYITARYIHNFIIFSGFFLLLASGIWGSFPPFSSLVSLSSRNRINGFTMTRVALNVGTGVGPGVAGILIGLYGFPTMYLSAFAATVLAFAVGIMFKSPVQEKATEKSMETYPKFSFKNINRTIILLSISSLLLTILLAQDTVTLPNYASIVRNLSTEQIGLVFTSNGILVVLMQYPVTRAIHRIGAARGYVVGLLFFSIGVFSFAFDSSILQFIGSEAVMTFGEDFLDPSGSSIVANLSPEKRLGEHMGVFNSFNAIGYSMGPLIGGMIISVTLNPYYIWSVVSLPGFIAVLIYMLFVMKKVVNAMGKSGKAISERV
jgi:MFS family permease